MVAGLCDLHSKYKIIFSYNTYEVCYLKCYGLQDSKPLGILPLTNDMEISAKEVKSIQ